MSSIPKLLRAKTGPRIEHYSGRWFRLYGNRYQIAGGSFHHVCRVARQQGLITRPVMQRIHGDKNVPD